MNKQIEIDKLQQQLLNELLEQDIEYLKSGIKQTKDDKEYSALCDCLNAEIDLINQIKG